MSLILLHSSHLCWPCTLRLQAPLVQGPPSTRGWEFLFVCLHKSSQYKNYLYYCPRPPLCHWSRQCTCSSDLFAYHKPGFLQLGKIMIILMNLLLLMIYDDIWFRLNCNQAFTIPTPFGIFFWISLWHHVSRDHMVSTLINSTPRKKDSQKYFSNFKNYNDNLTEVKLCLQRRPSTDWRQMNDQKWWGQQSHYWTLKQTKHQISWNHTCSKKYYQRLTRQLAYYIRVLFKSQSWPAGWKRKWSDRPVPTNEKRF